MDYVIPAQPIPSLAVEGARGRFPVHRIYCVGRNYAEHAREMGHDPDREPPFFFMKPADAIVTDGQDFDGSAPCSPIRRASDIGHPTKGAIWLEVNGTTRQRGDLGQLIWKIPE